MTRTRLDVVRSRGCRTLILQGLLDHYAQGLDLGYTAAQVQNLDASQCDFAAEEYTLALRSLEADGLIARVTDDDHQIARYVLTDDGHDFLKAGCPWGRIDRFSGDIPGNSEGGRC